MKALLPLALLAALSACDGRQKAAPVERNAASQDTTNEVALSPVEDPAATANAAAPPEAAEAVREPIQERFIVCPGNPRCPRSQQGRPPQNRD